MMSYYYSVPNPLLLDERRASLIFSYSVRHILFVDTWIRAVDTVPYCVFIDD